MKNTLAPCRPTKHDTICICQYGSSMIGSKKKWSGISKSYICSLISFVLIQCMTLIRVMIQTMSFMTRCSTVYIWQVAKSWSYYFNMFSSCWHGWLQKLVEGYVKGNAQYDQPHYKLKPVLQPTFIAKLAHNDTLWAQHSSYQATLLKNMYFWVSDAKCSCHSSICWWCQTKMLLASMRS